jgi:hypothetical protein
MTGTFQKNDGACLPGRASAHSGTEAAVGVVIKSDVIQKHNKVKLPNRQVGLTFSISA